MNYVDSKLFRSVGKEETWESNAHLNYTNVNVEEVKCSYVFHNVDRRLVKFTETPMQIRCLSKFGFVND